MRDIRNTALKAMAILVVLVSVEACCTKEVPQVAPPVAHAPAPVQVQCEGVEPVADEGEDHPVPKPLPRPGGLELDDEPVTVDKLLAPPEPRRCYSHEDCKLVPDNCGEGCECIAVHPSEEESFCPDKAPCAEDPCAGRVPSCAALVRGRPVCIVGILG